MSAAGRLSDATVTVIEPSKGWALPDVREIFAYRDLLLFLIRRNIKVRYRQTLLGGLWAILQPLLTMATMTVVFGKLIGVPSDGVPYWIFALASLVLWTTIGQAVGSTSSSLVGSADLVEKVYFPRLLIPISTIVAGLLDFAISFSMLLVVIAATGMLEGLGIVIGVGIALFAALLALGIGSALAALAVRFRDIGHIVPFFLQLWLLATPIVYPLSVVPERWRLIMAVNPATGLMEMFRWSLLGTPGASWSVFVVSTASLLVLLVGGLVLFRRMEPGFADVI